MEEQVMKKTYISPQTIVMTINAQVILAGSPYGKDIKEGDASDSYETLSRRRRFYDFDDEEEDYEY